MNRVPFTTEGKALQPRELASGDLILEGWAAVFSGTDRDGENFAAGCLGTGLREFLSGSSPLCFQHSKSLPPLGKVLDLREVEGKGIWMRARVDASIQKHPQLSTVYEQIKGGSIRALSLGGYFRRQITGSGPKIVSCDVVEVSATHVPKHALTSFEVVAGKALTDERRTMYGTPEFDLEVLSLEIDLARARLLLDMADLESRGR